MATMTVRNLPGRVVETLKNGAKRNGRSMEQEVREILSRFPDVARKPDEIARK